MTYLTPGEYRDRTGSPASAYADDLIDGVSSAASRLIDRRLGWAPGCLGPSTRTVTFWPGGLPDRVLRLRDAEGGAWPLRSWTSIEIDFSGDGRADVAVGPSSTVGWIVGQPDTPVPSERPWRALRIAEAHPDAETSIWPADPGRVVVAGGFGHSPVVPAAKELVAHVTRAVLDGHQGGAAAVVEVLDRAVSVNDPAGRIWRLLEMEFSAGRPGRHGIVTSAGARGFRR